MALSARALPADGREFDEFIFEKQRQEAIATSVRELRRLAAGLDDEGDAKQPASRAPACTPPFTRPASPDEPPPPLLTPPEVPRAAAPAQPPPRASRPASATVRPAPPAPAAARPLSARSSSSAPPAADGGACRAPRRLVYVGARAAPTQTCFAYPAAAKGQRPAREFALEGSLLPYAAACCRPARAAEAAQGAERQRRQVEMLKQVVRTVAKEREEARGTGLRALRLTKTLHEKAASCEQAAARAEAEVEACQGEMEALRGQLLAGRAEMSRLQARLFESDQELNRLQSRVVALEEDCRAAKSALELATAAKKSAQGESNLAVERADELSKTLKAKEAAAAELEQKLKESQDGVKALEAQRQARVTPQLVEVHPETSRVVAARVKELHMLSDSDLQREFEQYSDVDTVWNALTPIPLRKGQRDAPLVLLSGAWLLSHQPAELPERSRLPTDAIIPVARLKRIYDELASPKTGLAKPVAKLLPIVCILTPEPNLDSPPSVHSDMSGAVLDSILSYLSRAWPEFTNRVGGKAAGGRIEDIGVYVGWSSVYQGIVRDRWTRQRSEREADCYDVSIEAVHTLFAHKLTTVWVMPEARHAKGERGMPFRSAWASHLYHVATLLKSPLQAENLPWRQLVDLGEPHWSSLQHQVYGNGKLFRAPPIEPLAFMRGHSHDQLVGAQTMLARLHSKWTLSILAPLEELDFSRCGWTDEEMCRLAVVLPLCGRLQRLKLHSNMIGNVGATSLAAALAENSSLILLRTLVLDRNAIGDSGASRLFQIPGPNLGTLSLMNNEITEASVESLAKTYIPSHCLKAATKILLDGNPCSKKSRDDVKKALKRRAGEGNATAKS